MRRPRCRSSSTHLSGSMRRRRSRRWDRNTPSRACPTLIHLGYSPGALRVGLYPRQAQLEESCTCHSLMLSRAIRESRTARFARNAERKCSSSILSRKLPALSSELSGVTDAAIRKRKPSNPKIPIFRPAEIEQHGRAAKAVKHPDHAARKGRIGCGRYRTLDRGRCRIAIRSAHAMHSGWWERLTLAERDRNLADFRSLRPDSH